MRNLNCILVLLCALIVVDTDCAQARIPRSFFNHHSFQNLVRDSTDYSFCRVGNDTTSFSCLGRNFCRQEGGVNRGPCEDDEVCCEVIKPCGSTTSAHSVFLRNPTYPAHGTEDKVCTLTVKIGPDICALRLENHVFELTKFDDEYCPKDSLTILGTHNVTSPICGNMTGYTTTFPVEEYQKITLALVLQGTPAYRFSVQVLMVPCAEIVQFKAPTNAGKKNLDAPKYKFVPKGSANSTSSSSASKGTTPQANASTGTEATPTSTKKSTGGTTDTIQSVGVPLLAFSDSTSTSTTTATTPQSAEGTSTNSSKNATRPGESGSRLPPYIEITVKNPIYDKGCYRNNTLPMIINRSITRTTSHSRFKKRYEEVFKAFRDKLLAEDSPGEGPKCPSGEGQKTEDPVNEFLCKEQAVTESKFRVVGGRYANVGEYPWQVALVYKNKYFCSGSLITDRYVLTAGHCLFGSLSLGIDHISVLIGDFDLKSATDTHSLTYGVKRIMWNAHYNPVNVDNDIALLEICTPVEFSYNIRPVKLAFDPDYTYDGKNATIAGWGRYSRRSRKYSNILKEFHSTIANFSYCEQAWKLIPKVTAQRHMHLCLNITKGTPCYGDSGGPLVTCTGSDCTQIGIVSFAFPKCINVGLPAIFTAVSNYKEWIDMSLSYIVPTYHID